MLIVKRSAENNETMYVSEGNNNEQIPIVDANIIWTNLLVTFGTYFRNGRHAKIEI